MGIRVNGALMGWMAGEPLRQGFAARAEARGVSVEQLENELMTTTVPVPFFSFSPICRWRSPARCWTLTAGSSWRIYLIRQRRRSQFILCLCKALHRQRTLSD